MSTYTVRNCENCGAPLTLVREHDYLLCDYCKTYYFPQANADGVRLLGQDEEGRRCPVCQEPLKLASLDELPGLYCGHCRGLLMEQVVFGQLVALRRGRASGPGVQRPPLDRMQLERRLRCPNCGQVMETYPYSGPGNIVIDACLRCQAIWLDTGELQAIENAPGSDRGAGVRFQWVRHSEESWLAKSLRQQGKLKS